MTINLGVVMDPIQSIQVKKDTTLAMLLEAQQRGWIIHYMEPKDLFLKDGITYANSRCLKVFNDPDHWYEFAQPRRQALHQLDVILMRKDPPVDIEYIVTTYLLENAEVKGAFVVNKPQSLRDANEKLFTNWFAQCCPKTLVSRDSQLLREFMDEEGEIILKPLGAMGGASVFRIAKNDLNAKVIIETLTQYESRFVMAQRYIPDILKKGDKRILMIDGKPVPYGLARIPEQGDFRGNLAAGGRGVGVELNERDYWICEQVGPTLREKGLLFVGLDVIGDYLTEINVTSPTCVRELDAIFKINIAAQFLDVIENKVLKNQ